MTLGNVREVGVHRLNSLTAEFERYHTVRRYDPGPHLECGSS